MTEVNFDFLSFDKIIAKFKSDVQESLKYISDDLDIIREEMKKLVVRINVLQDTVNKAFEEANISVEEDYEKFANGIRQIYAGINEITEQTKNKLKIDLEDLLDIAEPIGRLNGVEFERLVTLGQDFAGK